MDNSPREVEKRLRGKYPELVVSRAATDITSGPFVEFDVEQRRTGFSTYDRTSKKGHVILVYQEKPGEPTRVAIVVPAEVESTGRVSKPNQLYTRERSQVNFYQRHGGPGHEAAAQP